jgi:hypothetical protein
MSDRRRALARPDLLDTTRLAMLSALGAAGSAVPIPLVPGAIERQVRGAVAHDVVTRAGLSLTLEARVVLSEVEVSNDKGRVVVREAAVYVARKVFKRVNPMSVLAPARAGLEIFALGVLLERYVRGHRRGPSVRVHVPEARGIRTAIDLAVSRALTKGVATDAMTTGAAAEDLRDDLTRVLDTVLLGGASVPGYLVRRIETAFDDVARDRPELFDG